MRSTIKCAVPAYSEEMIGAAANVLRSGNLVQGDCVTAFEDEFRDYLETDADVIACSSGTAALHLALLGVGVRPGCEVIVQPVGFFATVEAVLHCGATPVFCSTDEWGRMTPEAVQRALSPHTAAIVCTHVYGAACDVRGIQAVSEGTPVVEDAAQAHATGLPSGERAGTVGTAGCFSFFATKHTHTGGEGGAVVAHCNEVANSADMRRSHGMLGRDNHLMLGYNYRMTELAAAIGRVALSGLPDRAQRIASRSVTLQKTIANETDLRTVPPDMQLGHGWFWCPVMCNSVAQAHALRGHLEKRGIETRYRYSAPFWTQPILKTYSHEIRTIKGDESPAGFHVGLPNHHNLTVEEMRRIVDACAEFAPREMT